VMLKVSQFNLTVARDLIVRTVNRAWLL